jgi:hypothetical protein
MRVRMMSMFACRHQKKEERLRNKVGGHPKTKPQELSVPRGRCWVVCNKGISQQPTSVCCLSHGSDRSNRGSRDAADVDLSRDLANIANIANVTNVADTTNTRGVLLGAVARDVSSLTALVAGLSSGVERATVGSGAVSGDVAELAAGVALHSLSLAITGKVVGTTALVAGGRARAASEATSAVATRETTTAHRSTAAHGARTNRVGTSTSKVTGLATVVASTAGTGAAQAESRAVSLDVAETLAVIALLGLSSSGKRASVGLVARLLAVVAETLSRRADLSVVANIATLVASTSRERRHCEGRVFVARKGGA